MMLYTRAMTTTAMFPTLADLSADWRQVIMGCEVDVKDGHLLHVGTLEGVTEWEAWVDVDDVLIRVSDLRKVILTEDAMTRMAENRECAKCDAALGPEDGVQDEGQVFWMGAHRALWFCDAECLSNAAEDAASR